MVKEFKPHIHIPYEKIKGKNLTQWESFLFGLIYDHQCRGQEFFWTHKSIAELFEVSTRTIERAMLGLIDKQLITIQREAIYNKQGRGGQTYRNLIHICGSNSVEMLNNEPDKLVVSKPMNPTSLTMNPTILTNEPDNPVETDYIYEINNRNLQKKEEPPFPELSLSLDTQNLLPALRIEAYLSKKTEAEKQVLKTAIPKAVNKLQISSLRGEHLLSHSDALANLKLTPQGLCRLILEFKKRGLDANDLLEACEMLSDYIQNNRKGQKYKDHAAAIVNWVIDKVLDRKRKEVDLIRSEDYLANAMTRK